MRSYDCKLGFWATSNTNTHATLKEIFVKDIRDSNNSKEAGKPSLQRAETEDAPVNIVTLCHRGNHLVRTLPLPPQLLPHMFTFMSLLLLWKTQTPDGTSDWLNLSRLLLGCVTGLVEEGSGLLRGRRQVKLRITLLDFPGGAVVKNPSANAGDTGSSTGLGRSHMPRST